jgi:hypothetical protein
MCSLPVDRRVSPLERNHALYDESLNHGRGVLWAGLVMVTAVSKAVMMTALR